MATSDDEDNNNRPWSVLLEPDAGRLQATRRHLKNSAWCGMAVVEGGNDTSLEAVGKLMEVVYRRYILVLSSGQGDKVLPNTVTRMIHMADLFLYHFPTGKTTS